MKELLVNHYSADLMGAVALTRLEDLRREATNTPTRPQMHQDRCLHALLTPAKGGSCM